MAYPGFEGDEFEDHFHSEEAGEQHIEDIHSFAEGLRLAMMLQTNKLIKKIRFVYLSMCISSVTEHTDLHGQADGVEKDEGEHQVLKVGGVHHIPHLVLILVLGDVPAQGTGLQGIFHTLTLYTHRKLWRCN